MIDKIILFGSNGMLGNYVKTYFKRYKPHIKVIETTIRISKSNLCQLEGYLRGIGLDRNTCVINCAGAIPQRRPEDFWIINTVFPHILAIICHGHGAKMIHPTTDCVFSGSAAAGNYIETDVHDEKGEYGRSKSLGEPSLCTVIRTSIIGREAFNKKSFMEWILNSKGTINGFTNHLWNGVTCLEWCKIVDKIIEEDSFWTGVRHIASPKAYSKYELATMIKDIFQLDLTINPVITDEIVNKTLATITTMEMTIPDLRQQIEELKSFDL